MQLYKILIYVHKSINDARINNSYVVSEKWSGICLTDLADYSDPGLCDLVSIANCNRNHDLNEMLCPS